MKPLSTSVCIVTMEIEPAYEAEVNRWYAEEHIPALLGVPGYLKAERFVAVDGAPKYMAFYELSSPEAYHSREQTSPSTRPGPSVCAPTSSRRSPSTSSSPARMAPSPASPSTTGRPPSAA